MILSLDNFRKKIHIMFIRCNDKRGLFRSLGKQLNAYLNYPVEYLQLFLEMLSDPMPLHAAVSAEYYFQHGILTDYLSASMDEFRKKCEMSFMEEITSENPDTERCADLHMALSYIMPSHQSMTIPQAVEKLTDVQRNALFQEIGKCISDLHEISNDEKQLLDPILKYFSLHYPEKINLSFLEHNRLNLSNVSPSCVTLTELLIWAIRNKHFSYFRLLIAIFPMWCSDQQSVSVEDMINWAYGYADTPERILDVFYIALRLSKHGHTNYDVDNVKEWYRHINATETDFTLRQVVDFLYTVHCIEADSENAIDYILPMPLFTPDPLFRLVLPGELLPIGSLFVQKVTEKLLRHNIRPLAMFLEKLRENNLYHFNTYQDCPAAVPTAYLDYQTLLEYALYESELAELVDIYFNTHLRMMLPLTELGAMFVTNLRESVFNATLEKYTFTVIPTSLPSADDEFWLFNTIKFETRQFLTDTGSEGIAWNNDFGEEGEMQYVYHAILGGLRLKMQIKIHSVKNGMVYASFMIPNKKFPEYRQALQQADDIARSSWLALFQTWIHPDINAMLAEITANVVLVDEKILRAMLDAINSSAKSEGISGRLITMIELFRYPEDIASLRSILIEIWETIKHFGFVFGFDLLLHKPYNEIFDISEGAELINRTALIEKKCVYKDYRPCLDFPGKVFITEDGSAELVPDNVKSANYHIKIFSYSRYCSQEENPNVHNYYEPFAENAFFTQNSDIEAVSLLAAEIRNGTVDLSGGLLCRAYIYTFAPDANCFLCDISDISENISNERQQRIDKLHIVGMILEKACFDENAVNELLNCPYLEKNMFTGSFIHGSQGHIDIDQLITETIADRLKKHNTEAIRSYLEAVKPLICRDLKCICITDKNHFKNDSLAEYATRECDPELIADIYINSEHARTNALLNEWLNCADKYGKLQDFLLCLKDIKLFSGDDPYGLGISPFKQEICIGRCSIDGNVMENLMSEQEYLNMLFRIVGYDAENNIVLLKSVSQNGL